VERAIADHRRDAVLDDECCVLSNGVGGGRELAGPQGGVLATGVGVVGVAVVGDD